MLCRISVVRLRPQQNPEADILAVSYHAPYKTKMEQKHSVCQILLSFLDQVLTKMEISFYIIDGDFNFDALDFVLPRDMIVSFYETSR